MSEESIATLFDSSSEVTETTETSETSETSEVSETVEGEQESSTETEASEATEKAAKETEDSKEATTTSTEESNEKQHWTLSAVLDERQKRQKAEAENKELKSKLEGDKQVTPDIFEDQEGFVKSMNQKHQDDLLRTRIDIFREVEIEKHDDYIEKEAKFIELAKENPILLVQMQKASNPAKFAYEQIVKHEQFDDMQDMDGLRKKIRAEIKLELEGQLKKSETEEVEKGESLSPSLAKARGSTDKAEKLSDNPEDLF